MKEVSEEAVGDTLESRGEEPVGPTNCLRSDLACSVAAR